jgi:hypothetical protein
VAPRALTSHDLNASNPAGEVGFCSGLRWIPFPAERYFSKSSIRRKGPHDARYYWQHL